MKLSKSNVGANIVRPKDAFKIAIEKNLQISFSKSKTNGPTMLDPITGFVGLTELVSNLRVYVMFLLIQNLQDKM